MPQVEIEICQRYVYGRGCKGFELSTATFNMTVKKNKPKKMTKWNHRQGRAITTKEDAEIYIKNVDLWLPFKDCLEKFGYKTPSASLLVKFHRSLKAHPYDVWVNAHTLTIK
jgi:hypothetical protein